MRFSIITINYNNAVGLQRTMQSVLEQTCRDFEYIIVDGASTDNSVVCIRDYANSSTDVAIQWLSEPDTGIYNAMNKGLRLAQGDYCLFMNSGDCFSDNEALQRVVEADLHADVCYFDAFYVYPDGRRERRTYPDKLTMHFFFHDALCHQATFYRRSILLQAGGYDESVRATSDAYLNRDLLIVQGCTYKHYPIVITDFEMAGLSVTERGKQMGQQERQRYLSSRFSKPVAEDYQHYLTIINHKTYRQYTALHHLWSKKIVDVFLKIIHRIDSLF